LQETAELPKEEAFGMLGFFFSSSMAETPDFQSICNDDGRA
jgi:hypothetical protein